jgi:hypothetical protein
MHAIGVINISHVRHLSDGCAQERLYHRSISAQQFHLQVVSLHFIIKVKYLSEEAIIFFTFVWPFHIAVIPGITSITRESAMPHFDQCLLS